MRTGTRCPAKIALAGGFGAGKTTLVGTVSEITPLTTEAVMTSASTQIDDLTVTPHKMTTTVAMVFGRVTLDLILYLFGTLGQHRFRFMWDDLVHGAIGTVVPVDTRHLADAFAPIDFLEDRGLPFVIVVNHFDDAQRHTAEEVRDALTIDASVPVMACDARERQSVTQTLIAVVEHTITSMTGAHP